MKAEFRTEVRNEVAFLHPGELTAKARLVLHVFPERGENTRHLLRERSVAEPGGQLTHRDLGEDSDRIVIRGLPEKRREFLEDLLCRWIPAPPEIVREFAQSRYRLLDILTLSMRRAWST